MICGSEVFVFCLIELEVLLFAKPGELRTALRELSAARGKAQVTRHRPHMHGCNMFTTRFSLAEMILLDGTVGAGRIAHPASTRISARMKRVQGHVCRVTRTPLLQK